MNMMSIETKDLADLFGITEEKIWDEFSYWYQHIHEMGKDVCNETEETFFKHLRSAYDMVKS